MFSQHQINSCSWVKFCKCSNGFVIIFITDSASFFSVCSRCLYSTDNVFYRDIAAITTLWPVEYFLWPMGCMNRTSTSPCSLSTLLTKLTHGNELYTQEMYDDGAMLPVSARVGILKSWTSTNKSSSLHSLCPICDADWGMKWLLLLVPGSILPSSNLFSIISHTSTMSSLSMPKKIIDLISSWHTFSTAWLLSGLYKLCFAAWHFTTPPISSHGSFPWLVAKKIHSASMEKSSLWEHKLRKFFEFLCCPPQPSET